MSWTGTTRDLDKLRRYADEAHKKAADAAAKWREEHAYLVEYCKANNYRSDQRRNKIADDPILSDINATWSWWEREAKRIDSIVQREAMLELLTVMSRSSRPIARPRHPVESRRA